MARRSGSIWVRRTPWVAAPSERWTCRWSFLTRRAVARPRPRLRVHEDGQQTALRPGRESPGDPHPSPRIYSCEAVHRAQWGEVTRSQDVHVQVVKGAKRRGCASRSAKAVRTRGDLGRSCCAKLADDGREEPRGPEKVTEAVITCSRLLQRRRTAGHEGRGQKEIPPARGAADHQLAERLQRSRTGPDKKVSETVRVFDLLVGGTFDVSRARCRRRVSSRCAPKRRRASSDGMTFDKSDRRLLADGFKASRHRPAHRPPGAAALY